MSERARKLLREALELPLPDRAEIAADLLASLDGESDEDVEAAWAAEMSGGLATRSPRPMTMSPGTTFAPS